MKAIIGLGNPGDEYENTRHNAGWTSLDALALELNSNYWKDECGAKVSHIKNSQYASEELLLVKPQSFMNLSGGPVKNLVEKYKLSLDDLIVIHDDMDIASGHIRVRRGGSSAGHNGLKSITSKLQSDDYYRIRVGIDHAPGHKPYADYVLDEPRGKQLEEFKLACNLAAECTLFLLNHTLEEAQQKYNCKN